jgi:DNA-binding NarL/FixJ family response regulator
MVSSGLTNRQIAELSYVSENTIKQHMKRIFGKMNVSSRAELVQAVWRSSRGNADSDAADRSAPEESC